MTIRGLFLDLPAQKSKLSTALFRRNRKPRPRADGGFWESRTGQQYPILSAVVTEYSAQWRPLVRGAKHAHTAINLRGIEMKKTSCMPCVVLLLLALSVAGKAQSSDLTRLSVQKRFSPFWTNLPECRTTIYLHNNLVDTALSVRPTLYLKMGRRLNCGTWTCQSSAALQYK